MWIMISHHIGAEKWKINMVYLVKIVRRSQNSLKIPFRNNGSEAVSPFQGISFSGRNLGDWFSCTWPKREHAHPSGFGSLQLSQNFRNVLRVYVKHISILRPFYKKKTLIYSKPSWERGKELARLFSLSERREGCVDLLKREIMTLYLILFRERRILY